MGIKWWACVVAGILVAASVVDGSARCAGLGTWVLFLVVLRMVCDEKKEV